MYKVEGNLLNAKLACFQHLTGMTTKLRAKVEAADVASSLTPPMPIALPLKELAPNAVAVLAPLAPRVARAERNTALDLDELTPFREDTCWSSYCISSLEISQESTRKQVCRRRRPTVSWCSRKAMTLTLYPPPQDTTAPVRALLF